MTLPPKPFGKFAGLENTLFGDDCGDVFGWRDVEGGIQHLGTDWGDRLASEDRGDFLRVPLFNRNLIAGRRGQVNGRMGCGDVKWNPMRLG